MRYATGVHFALVMTLAAAPLAGQSLFTDRARAGIAWLEVQRPSFDDDGDLSTWLANVGLRFRVASGVSLVGAVPVGRVSGNIPVHEGATRIGNPYLGLRFDRPTTPVWVELGVYAPLFKADDNGDILMALANFFGDVDRFEAFWPKTVAPRLLVGATSRFAQGTFLTVRAGPSVLIPTGDNDAEMEVLIDYQGAAGVDIGRATIQAGLTGRFIAKGSEGGNFGERTIHQAGLSLAYQLHRVRPQLWVRVPLDQDLKDALTSVVGVSMTVALP